MFQSSICRFPEILVLAVSCVSLISHCQGQAVPQSSVEDINPNTNAVSARIESSEFTESRIDDHLIYDATVKIGIFRSDVPLKIELQIEPPLRDDFDITSTRSSCGCLSTVIEKRDNKRLIPATITLSENLAVGEIQKDIQFFLTNRTVINIKIEGQSHRAQEIGPEKIVWRIKPREPDSRTIHFEVLNYVQELSEPKITSLGSEKIDFSIHKVPFDNLDQPGLAARWAVDCSLSEAEFTARVVGSNSTFVFAITQLDSQGQAFKLQLPVSVFSRPAISLRPTEIRISRFTTSAFLDVILAKNLEGTLEIDSEIDGVALPFDVVSEGNVLTRISIPAADWVEILSRTQAPNGDKTHLVKFNYGSETLLVKVIID